MAPSLLNELQSKGVHFSIEHEHLKIDAPQGVVTSEMKEVIRENKPAIIELLKNESLFDDCRLRELFEERAAIHQFDAGMIREEAEAWAFREVWDEYGIQHLKEAHDFVVHITRQKPTN